MSGLIKQQISKRLSKFTKNLSTHQINLSAMKGEGDLTNLELDEVVLMDLLGAPSWMKLTRAFCNRLTIKVQWTKLSSQPIVLILDEVNIDIETCDSRDQSTENTFLSHSPGKYGYTDQIMDGMSLSINVININFRSSSFRATFQMSRVTIESRTPIWQVGSLDRTRIKNDLRGEVIIFKEVQWQAVRIEANALTNWIMTTPLRLIANQSKIRITLKKKMSDCGIICTKVEVNMDDILWVLTDSQVFAAMTFVDDLRNIILNQNNRVRPPSKSQSNNSISKSPSVPHKTLSQRQTDLEKFFDKFNESSYHFFSGRIELHLCDDISQENSSYRCRVEGGAMQLVLNQLEFSYYPLRPAASSRQEWPRYNDCNAAVERWTKSLLSNYLKNPDVIGWHLERFSKDVKQELMESCTVLRLKDLCLYCVSSSKDCKKSKPRKFFCSDKRRLLLPDDMPVFHVEFTDYYNCPVPSSLHVTVNPVCLSIHHPSLLWINVFCLNVMKKSEILPERKSSMKQIDTKMDVLMPRITLPASEIQENGKDEELLQIHSSKLLITNLFTNDSSQKNSTRILASQFQTYKSSKFCNSGFRCRSSAEEDGRSGTNETSTPPLRLPHGFVDTITKSTTSLKKQDDDEMWCVICDQFWIDFLTPNKQSSHPQGRKFKTQNFLEAFPFTMWLLMSPVKEITPAEVGRPRIEQEVTCLTCIDVSVKVILDCQQLNFLTRLVSLASKTWDEKIYDAYRIGLSLPTVETITKLLLLLPNIELCFILPSSLMTSSSSTSIPCISSSSSSSLSLSNRVAEHQNGQKHNNAIASNDDQPKSHSSKMISKDDLMINGNEIKQTNRSRVEPGLNHFLEISSFESMRKQTKDTMSTMLYGLSNKFKGSDSSIHDHLDEEDWIMMFHNQPETPAFEKSKEICDDNDFDDVISDSSSNKKKVISILRVGLQSLEMLLQMNERNMEVMMMIDNVSTEEVDKINYEKFKTTYLLASNESIPLYPSTAKSVDESDFLKFHYEIARLPEITNSKDNLQLEVQNGKLKLKTSTLLKFVKVFEGHDAASTDGPSLEMLMYILMRNVSIDIMDKNSDYKISVDSLQISKGEDGIIRIGNEISTKEVNTEHTNQEERELSQDESELEHENETLKKQLEKLGRLTMSDGFDDLKQWRKKCQKLESDVKDMDSQVKRLSAERDSLLRLVDTLQSALESSEKMRSKHA